MVKVLDKVKDGLFAAIHGNHLIYNACWEDPRCDHEVLQLDAESKVVVITSAGCNALDYALRAPKHVYCIDVNHRQNATLELKKALALHTDHETLFTFFGKGFHPDAALVIEELREHLPQFAYDFWKEKARYFSNPNRTFYYRGTSGNFAWVFRKYLRSQNAHDWVLSLVNAKSLDEQREWYGKIEPVIFKGFIKWMMGRHITMSMLGVPRPQRQLLIDGYEGGIAGFLKDALYHVFAELPIQDNYFWRAYLTGSYTHECCPEYLKPENFEALQQCVHRVSTHTTTVSDFLENNPSDYSHFILLDHQDWLAAHNVKALEDEWYHIISNSSADAKVLMRSAAQEIDFFPRFVKEAFALESDVALHQKCRVGTYCSTYVGHKRAGV